MLHSGYTAGMSEAIGLSHEFIALQSRGLLALPSALRKKYGLDEPGAQVEITERDDGVIEIRPHTAIPTPQTWFWQPAWQAREQQVDRHVAAGQVKVHDSAEDFLLHLDQISTDR